MTTTRNYRCDLDVLQDKITPLPWSEFCESGDWWIESADEDGSPLVGRAENPDENFVADATRMSSSNMLYIVWAANTAPELVKALEAAEARVRELEAVLTEVSEVQWVNDQNGDMRCALCDHYLDKERHTDDCPFMAARAVLDGES